MAANDAVSMNVAENRQNVPMAIQENRAAVPMVVAEGGGTPGGLNRKADKVTGAAAGNLAGLDSTGNLTDSGKAPADFLEAPAAAGSAGQVLTADGEGSASWQDPTGGDPTEIIDDTAGSGDTDKVWSADKLSGIDSDVGDLKSAIDEKLDAPETAGTAGQVLSLDNNLDPVWTTPQSGGGTVTDVQVNGTSILSQGVANIPLMSTSDTGVAKLKSGNGVRMVNGALATDYASDNQIKAGTNTSMTLVPYNQHRATFYGLAKCAGNSDQSSSSNAVGVYTEDAKSKISDMLDAPETVSGTTPSIAAKPGVRYVCGEVSTLTIVAPASGCIDVTFESGSTPTVLTVTPQTGVTMKYPAWFDPTSLEANTTYEINIADGKNAVVMAWT